MQCEVSVLICAFNEVDNIPSLFERVYATLETLDTTYEIVIVDDGSTDGTSEILDQLAARHPFLKVVKFVRNFGQHAAFAAGLEYVSGERVVWMDADLQDLPEEIPKLIAKHREGHEIIYAIREQREDSAFRTLGSRLFFRLFNSLAGQNLPRNMSTFRVMSRKVTNAFLGLKERNRISAGLIGWLGFPYETVPVRHAAREHGTSKYTPAKLFRLAFDSVAGYSYFPLRLATYTGGLVSVGAFLMTIWVIVKKLLFGIIVTGYASLLAGILFLGGIQLMVMGILGEYIGRILTEVQGRPLFVVAEELNLSTDNPRASQLG